MLLTGKNEPTAAPYGIAACGRSGLVVTTLDHAQKAVAHANVMVALAKLVFLRM
jgi:hypothetical protein